MSEQDVSGYHMSGAEFRRAGHELVEWIADYLEGVETLPVAPAVQPGDILAQLPTQAPQTGESMRDIMEDVANIILPGITHWQSPRFFAYFPANSSPPAILGEMLSAGLGVQGMSWSTSPACTELEIRVVDWVRQLLDLPVPFSFEAGGGGVIEDSASGATLCAMIAARERCTNGEVNRRGNDGSLVAYASDQVNSSFEKDIKIAGIGRDNMRLIDTGECFGMNPTALAQAVQKDIAAGKRPFFVCATVGTTSSLAVDPVAAIAEICKEHDIWLHVDAAMAGTAAACPEYRWLNDGVKHADSYTFNPHKWMFTNFDCNVLFVADRQALTGALSLMREYLRNPATDSGEVVDYRDWQIPLGRRFRALKLWFVMRHYGVEGLRFHIRKHVTMATELAAWIEADPDFVLVTDRSLNLVCFRHVDGEAFNTRLLEVLNRGGRLFLSHTRLGAHYTLRLCVGQTMTEPRHVEEAWTEIRAAAASLRAAA